MCLVGYPSKWYFFKVGPPKTASVSLLVSLVDHKNVVHEITTHPNVKVEKTRTIVRYTLTLLQIRVSKA